MVRVMGDRSEQNFAQFPVIEFQFSLCVHTSISYDIRVYFFS